MTTTSMPYEHAVKILGYISAATFLGQKLAEQHQKKAGPWLDDLEEEAIRQIDMGTGSGPVPDSLRQGHEAGVRDIFAMIRNGLSAG